MNSERIDKYGVVLRKLQAEDLEMLRSWRNHTKISQYMSFREHISAEMQAAWYRTVNNDQNHYFVIEWESRDVGLINIKDIDDGDKNGESGMFIWDDHCLNSEVPPRASLALVDFAFEVLGLRSLRAHVLKSNQRAVRYNKGMGYKLQEGQDEVENQLYLLTRKDALKWRDRVACLFR